MFRLLILCLPATWITSAANADEMASPEPAGAYICLQNAALTGSVWHPVECKRLADVEDQIADHTGQPVVQLDRIEPPNALGSMNIWWKIELRGVGDVTDKTAHWFCSDHGSAFSCLWQNTNNPEDWAAYNQFRDYGMTDIPSVFSVPRELADIYRDSKPLFDIRAANEARYAKAEALAKSSAFQWAFISY